MWNPVFLLTFLAALTELLITTTSADRMTEWPLASPSLFHSPAIGSRGRTRGKAPVDMETVVDPTSQFWGLVEVRPGARMFYWLYHTRADEHHPSARPLVLWLHGGPGVSASGYANFQELGIVDTQLQSRNLTWVNDVNVLFVDSPVGTGFSAVDSPELLAKSNEQVANDLVTLVQIFMERYPAFISTPLYVFSEAYGGKMAAQFAFQLTRTVQKGQVRVNLKGLAMGDPWISPIDIIESWAPYLYQQGLVGAKGSEHIAAAAQKVRKAMERGEWDRATTLCNATVWHVLRQTGGIDMRNVLTRVSARFFGMLGGVIESGRQAPVAELRAMLTHKERRKGKHKHPKVPKVPKVPKPPKEIKDTENVTDIKDTEDVTDIKDTGNVTDVKDDEGPKEPRVPSKITLDELMNEKVLPRLTLPEGVRWKGVSQEVFAALSEDFMKPATDAVESLLNETNVEVAVFNSQFDVFANPGGAMKWLERLKWPGSELWEDAPRKMLPIRGVIEGDRKRFGNLVVYWLRRVGQMLVSENPVLGRELLRRVTKFDQEAMFDFISVKT